MIHFPHIIFQEVYTDLEDLEADLPVVDEAYSPGDSDEASDFSSGEFDKKMLGGAAKRQKKKQSGPSIASESEVQFLFAVCRKRCLGS